MFTLCVCGHANAHKCSTNKNYLECHWCWLWKLFHQYHLPLLLPFNNFSVPITIGIVNPLLLMPPLILVDTILILIWYIVFDASALSNSARDLDSWQVWVEHPGRVRKIILPGSQRFQYWVQWPNCLIQNYAISYFPVVFLYILRAVKCFPSGKLFNKIAKKNF